MFGRSRSDALFFDAFRDHARHILTASRCVVRMFDELPRREELAGQIRDAEHAGDEVTRTTIRRLHETWITPLDRADIHTLISRMDDVLDLSHAVAKRIVLFDIGEARTPAPELAKILLACTERVAAAVEELPSIQRSTTLLDQCKAIDRLESEADEHYRQGLAALYRPGNEPLDVLKWRDIFDALETATDRCADVANALESIVLEYG